MNCVRRGMKGDARQREVPSDMRARHCGWKQVAVDMQQPAKAGSDCERLVGGCRKIGKESFASKMWLSLKALLKTTP